MAVANGSLSTSTPLQSKMTTGPPMPRLSNAAYSRTVRTNQQGRIVPDRR
jgi:hypothetical protein